ncbi:hypothetical protein ACQ4PT_070532 [Festuca glaucescens]
MAPRIWVARFLFQKKPYHRVRAADLCSHLGCLPRGCIAPPADPDFVRANGVAQTSLNTFGDVDQSTGPVAPLHFLQGHIAGLCNLGNTYDMSSLQCLHSVPELKSALRRIHCARTQSSVFRRIHCARTESPVFRRSLGLGDILRPQRCRTSRAFGLTFTRTLSDDPKHSRQPCDTEDNGLDPFIVVLGDNASLLDKIDSIIKDKNGEFTEAAIKDRFRKVVEPQLTSRGVLLHHHLEHASTKFVYFRTKDIVGRKPMYMTSLDVMGHEKRMDEDEWQRFLRYLVKGRIFDIKNWSLSFSSIQSLMYDFGIITPDDGTNVDFYKGECDGSYDEKTGLARLSFLLFKGTNILCCQVYHGVPCESSVQAEAFAAAALLFAAEQNGVKKMVLWTDCEATHIVLSGEKNLRFPDKNLGVLVMLREQRKKFERVVSMWKPRELNCFADELCTLDMEITLHPMFPHQAMDRWKTQMEGSPVFRFKQKNEITNITKVFVDVPSFGDHLSSTVRLHVESVCKFECLVGLQDGFEPDDFYLAVHGFDKKPEEVRLKILELFGEPINFRDIPGEKGAISIFHNAASLKNMKVEKWKSMMVYFDTHLWGKSFVKSVKSDITVVLASPEEAGLADRLRLRKLSALDYVRFNQKK